MRQCSPAAFWHQIYTDIAGRCTARPQRWAAHWRQKRERGERARRRCGSHVCICVGRLKHAKMNAAPDLLIIPAAIVTSTSRAAMSHWLSAGMNILVCTPGRLLQHMDETPSFDATNLQVSHAMHGNMCLQSAAWACR